MGTTTTTNQDGSENDDENRQLMLFQREHLRYVKMVFSPWLKEWASKKFSRPTPNYDKTAFLVMDGLTYGEAPRIHNGYLYVSIMHNNCVYKIDINDNHKLVKRIDFDDKVSGLGWLPNGKMLVAAMTKRKLYCYDESTDTREDYADLSKVTQYRVNDMVVDCLGNAYVGNFGFDFRKLITACSTTLVRVDPSDRTVHIESTGMLCPNGCVVTPDGTTLLVNETFRGMTTAFDRNTQTGELSNRRVWADVESCLDGCCLDAEGCLWTAIPQCGSYNTSGCFARISPETGRILETLGFGRNGLRGKAIACTLATLPDGRHVLYMLESDTIDEDLIHTKYGSKNSRLKAVYVDVGPAKHPEYPHYNAGYC